MNKIPRQIIVIDDDIINNMLCGYVIKAAKMDLSLQTFSVPEIGFEYIETEFTQTTKKPTVLFLDINMPTWSGWDFLEKFEKLNEQAKSQIQIYMLTSSLDPKDKERAQQNKYVIDYIVKPLTIDLVKNIVGK